MCTPSFGKGFVVLFKLSQEHADGYSDRQTDRWTKNKPIIPFGETGRGLNMQVFDKTEL